MDAREFADAYRKFVELRHSHAFSGPEVMSLQSYDLCERLRGCAFKVPMVDMQVASDLKELINCQNHWVNELSKWRTWQHVLLDYDEEAQWDLRLEFIDGIARACMLEPSAMRDRVLRALCFVLHHANMTVVPGYKDELPEDVAARKRLLSGKNPQAGHRSRDEWIAKSGNLARHWSSGVAVLNALTALDSELYRERSMDYRNASSHSIAPHFEAGLTFFVTRRLKFASIPVKRTDGSVDFVDDRSRFAVSYVFGERPPLKYVDAFSDNRLQLAAMRNVMARYHDFLVDVTQQIAHARQDEKQQPTPSRDQAAAPGPRRAVAMRASLRHDGCGATQRVHGHPDLLSIR